MSGDALGLPYSVEVREHVDKIFHWLRKKNRSQLEAIYKKLAEVCEDPHRYKPLHSYRKGLSLLSEKTHTIYGWDESEGRNGR